MHRILTYALWSSVALGAIALMLIAGYAAGNRAGHSGWEPFTALFLFIPIALLGAGSCLKRQKCAGVARASVCAVAIGLGGIALIVTLDRTNRLVEYERWLNRGMPC